MLIHGVAKANRGERVFDDRVVDDDFRSQLGVFKSMGGSVLAYALMLTHAHFLVEVPDDQTYAAATQTLLRHTAWRRNRRWGQTGHVFRHHHFRRQVSPGADERNVASYIHRNPCPLGRNVGALDCGDQTSHAAWLRKPPEWLDAERGLSAFGGVEGYLRFQRERMRRVVSLPGIRIEMGEVAEGVVWGLCRELRMRPSTMLSERRGGTPERRELARRLAAAGLRGGEVADALQINRVTLWRWLSEDAPPSPP